MDWYIIPNENTDLVHYGTKGQKWGKRKQKTTVGKIPAKMDEQMTSSHKSLGSMKYDDALKYYKSINTTSPNILDAWLQKHNIGLNSAQYKKYVLNAVKKAQSGADRSNALKNITNRALGKSERYQTESIPTYESSNKKKTTTTKKKTSTRIKDKVTNSAQNDNKAEIVARKLSNEASTLHNTRTAKDVRIKRATNIIKKYLK